jgi:hypothetical protein
VRLAKKGSQPKGAERTWLKKEVNLKELNVQEMDIETVDGLEGLAWHELVTVAETQLPILVLDDMSTITGAIQIKNYLLNLKEKESGK